MIQSGSRLRFALEAGQGLRIAGHFVGEKLEGDETMEGTVSSACAHHPMPPPPSLSRTR